MEADFDAGDVGVDVAGEVRLRGQRTTARPTRPIPFERLRREILPADPFGEANPPEQHSMANLGGGAEALLGVVANDFEWAGVQEAGPATGEDEDRREELHM